ncbi:MAG: hypothetical protein MJ252_29330 [archaeon]|nr:hypothetical protein [archaeon]
MIETSNSEEKRDPQIFSQTFKENNNCQNFFEFFLTSPTKERKNKKSQSTPREQKSPLNSDQAKVEIHDDNCLPKIEFDDKRNEETSPQSIKAITPSNKVTENIQGKSPSGIKIQINIPEDSENKPSDKNEFLNKKTEKKPRGRPKGQTKGKTKKGKKTSAFQKEINPPKTKQNKTNPIPSYANNHSKGIKTRQTLLCDQNTFTQEEKAAIYRDNYLMSQLNDWTTNPFFDLVNNKKMTKKYREKNYKKSTCPEEFMYNNFISKLKEKEEPRKPMVPCDKESIPKVNMDENPLIPFQCKLIWSNVLFTKANPNKNSKIILFIFI